MRGDRQVPTSDLRPAVAKGVQPVAMGSIEDDGRVRVALS